MGIKSKSEVLEILEMPRDEFEKTVKSEAKAVHREAGGDAITVNALFGYDNICRNQCTYCGMRAGNFDVKRYRIGLEDAKKTIESVKGLGLGRLFLISGEDPKYDFRDIVSMVEYGKALGLFMSLAAGEFDDEEYIILMNAGLDEYVLKFETSDREMFGRIKPSTTFEKRMKCIDAIRDTGMALGSGNIVGLPKQSLGQVADDIMLMKELGISWAPIIPYMPVPGTPLAEEGGRGSLETTMKEIAILRLMMPQVHITAQQPGKDAKNGLADVEGNLDALASGADMLFVDMLPSALRKEFNVISDRMIQGMDKVRNLSNLSGMPIL